MDIPVLVICGSDDRMTPASFGRALAAGIPGARLVIIKNAGHYINLEQPQAVADVISTFITDQH
jgi:pimeloyl-ACP methyl ester carboxylesterase